MLEKIERYVPEGIPFPSTRGYAYMAKINPFLRDCYREVAQRVAKKLKERYGRFIGWLIYKAVTIHSVTTREELESVLTEPENRFKAYKIREDYPFILEAVLFKI